MKKKIDSDFANKTLIFPNSSEYEDAISLGSKSFKTLKLEFEMSNPKMHMWTFGVGQFAVVFKAKMNGKYYAVRCFQHSTTKGLLKYAVLSDYLKKKKIQWLSSFSFYDNEIIVNNKEYPVLLMDWVEGSDIHEFITDNLYSNYWLLELQKALVLLSTDLEKRGIGHGDLQKGNVIVIKEEKKVSLKLIDYDGMFVSTMLGEESTELGKPDIQHPKRDKKFFNEKIDRFSIWLIITAIEALKYDKSLWNRISDGGYNDESNFLFSFNDLNNNTNSPLFSKLVKSPHESVKEYAKLLIDLCNNEIGLISAPRMLSSLQKEKLLQQEDIKLKEGSKKNIKKTTLQKENTNIDIPKETVDKVNEIAQKEQVLAQFSKKIKTGKSNLAQKKTGKNFDVKDISNQTFSESQYKKGGSKFDVKDKNILSSSNQLSRVVKSRNMFAGLFTITLLLSIFLFISYSDKMLGEDNIKNQLEQTENTVQTLNTKANELEINLDEMTKDRDGWKRSYNYMESDRDGWKSSYYDVKSEVDDWKRWRKTVSCYDPSYKCYEPPVYAYNRPMCSCY